MKSLKETREAILKDPDHWSVHLMDFVDDFRYYRNARAIEEPFERNDDQWAALLASTAETLCSEMGLAIPAWLHHVPACRDPWFVSELENLKAISLVESPLPFRIRKVFVLENFLTRV